MHGNLAMFPPEECLPGNYNYTWYLATKWHLYSVHAHGPYHLGKKKKSCRSNWSVQNDKGAVSPCMVILLPHSSRRLRCPSSPVVETAIFATYKWQQISLKTKIWRNIYMKAEILSLHRVLMRHVRTCIQFHTRWVLSLDKHCNRILLNSHRSLRFQEMDS